MILTSFVTVGFADDPARISFGAAEISGDDIKVPVALGGGITLDKISSFTVTYEYDTDRLTYDGIEDVAMKDVASFTNDETAGELRISWFADENNSRPAVTLTQVNGWMFYLKFKKVADATGVSAVWVDDKAAHEISSDTATVTPDLTYARIDVEITPPIIAFGTAVKQPNGEIHIPVSLDRSPVGFYYIASFTMEYTYDNTKLRYVRTDDGVISSENAQGDYAADGKISYFTEQAGFSLGTLFTLVFRPVDASYVGTTTVKPTFVEMGDRYNRVTSDLVLNGTDVELVAGAQPKVTIKQHGITTGGEYEFSVVVDSVPDSFEGKLNSFDMKYSYDTDLFKDASVTSDVFTGEFATGEKISGYTKDDITVGESGAYVATISIKKIDCESEGVAKINVESVEIGRDGVTDPVIVTDVEVETFSADKTEHKWMGWWNADEGKQENHCSVCGKIDTRTVPIKSIASNNSSIEVPYAKFKEGKDAVEAFINGKEDYTEVFVEYDNEVILLTRTAVATVDMDKKEVTLTYTNGNGDSKSLTIPLTIGDRQLIKIEAKDGSDVVSELEIPFSVSGLDNIKAYIESKGIKIYATYEDGEEDVTASAKLEVESESRAVYTFGDKTAVITLTRPGVVLESIEVNPTVFDIPYATVKAGEDAVKEFIKDKYTVKAKLNDGSTPDVTANATATVDIAKNEVTVSYTRGTVTKTAKITLNVGAPLLTKIEARKGADVITSLEIPFGIDSLEDIKTYIESQGIEVYGIYEDENSTKVAAALTVDATKATYTFEGKDAVITLTRPAVVLDSIEVNPTELDIPYATVKAGEDAVKEYIKGKYTVTAKYNSGSTLDVTDKATVVVNTETDEIVITYTENGILKSATIDIKRGAPQLVKMTVRQGSMDITEIKYCVTDDLPRLKAFVDGLRLKVYGIYEDDTENEVVDASLDFYNYEKFIWKAGELTAEVAVKYIDHNWEFVSEVAPTQDTDGTKSYRCKLCGEPKDVTIPKLSAEVDTITADPTTIDVSYDIWSDANAADKIAGIIRNKVKLTAEMTDGNTYTDLINEATITVDTDAKTAKISYGGKDTEITLNFAPDPSGTVESIAVTPTSLTIAYADWYGKTTEQLAAFIKAYNGYKVTATKSDNTTEDVTEDAVITVTMGSNLSGTATVTYEGKTAIIALAFTPSSSTSGSGNTRRPGGGGTFTPGGNTTVVPTPTPSDDSIFKDLPKDHFAYDAVMDLYNKGIVSGDGNNYIYPEDGITREEIAKIALTVNQIPEETGLEIDAADKGDVSAWATNIVATAMKKGILVGYDDGTIRPKQVVSREEMVAMFIRALGVQADNKSTNFSDVSAEAWSAAYVAAASDLGFVKGYEDGTFRPANNITRAEAFVICHRIMQFRDTLTAAIAG